MIFWTGSFLQEGYDPDGNHFLGSMEQFRDPDNVYTRSIVVATFPDSTVKVASESHYDTWYKKYVGIKERIAVINDEKTDDMTAYMSTLRTVWLPMVESFQQEFGRHMVPVDVRSSVYSIRGHLGLPVQEWPPVLVIQRIDSDRFDVRTPASVDHLGCEITRSNS